MLDHPEIALVEPQRRIHPDLRDRDEFLVGHRVDDLFQAIHRVVGVAALLVAADEMFDRMLAVSVLDHDVDQSQLQHATGGHQLAAHDDALGDVRAQAPDEEAVGAHAGDQVEQHLGQAELGALLGNHDVARDRGLESAAESPWTSVIVVIGSSKLMQLGYSTSMQALA